MRKADYPDYAAKLAQNMKSVSDALVFLICGSVVLVFPLRQTGFHG